MPAVTSLTISPSSASVPQYSTVPLTAIGVHADTTTETIDSPDVRGVVGLTYAAAINKDVDGYPVGWFYSASSAGPTYPGGTAHNLGPVPRPLGPDSHATYGLRYAEFRLAWSTFETAEDTYDWRLLDAIFGRVIAHDKRVMFSVTAGSSTPSWVTTAVDHPFTLYPNAFVPTGGGGAATATLSNLPNVIDPNFIYRWVKFNTALATYLTEQGYMQYIDQVKMQGFNLVSAEMRLATGTGTQAAADGSLETDDYAMWSSVGYTPNRMLAAWAEITDMYDTLFPGIQLAHGVIFPDMFPVYGGTATYHVTEDPSQVLTGGQATTGITSSAQLDSIVAQTTAQVGADRYAINWNAIKGTTTSSTQLLQGYAAGGTVIGYQLDSPDFVSPNCPVIVGPTPYGDIRASSLAQQSACAPATFYNYGGSPSGALDVALAKGTWSGGAPVGADWVECWLNTCLAYNTEALAGDAALRARHNVVRWSSSDQTIATVNNLGVVTGLTEGTATITAYHVASGLSQTVDVTVTETVTPTASVVSGHHATLSGANVAEITVTGNWPLIEVWNGDITNTIYVTIGDATGPRVPDDPSVAGADTFPIPPGRYRQLLAPPALQSNGDVMVKLIGNGGDFSVHGFRGASL